MTPQGAALLERHRVEQGRIGATTAAAMLKIWPLLVAGGRLDENTQRWLDLAVEVMRVQRQRSATLAAQFAVAYRAVESGLLDGYQPVPALELNLEAARTSLMVLGPQAYKKHVATQLGVQLRDLNEGVIARNPLNPGLQDKIAANGARAAMRHVRNGGRETLDDVNQRDKAVLGHVRITSATPCWFCAMLASRGPVYQEDSFEDSDPRFHGPGNQKVHDGCGCDLLPMYRRVGEQWPGRAKEFDTLWRQTGSALAFRRAYEGRA